MDKAGPMRDGADATADGVRVAAPRRSRGYRGTREKCHDGRLVGAAGASGDCSSGGLGSVWFPIIRCKVVNGCCICSGLTDAYCDHRAAIFDDRSGAEVGLLIRPARSIRILSKINLIQY
jgi:hypothetical protein